MQETIRLRQELKAVFVARGPRAALAYLNALTTHRFTSLFCFDHEMLRKIIFYDRENPELDHCEDIPVLASYCVFVRNSGKKFKTEDSTCDSRVEGHPKQKTVQSYCGVPLLDSDGKLFGTICHFDFKPGRISELEVDLLEHIGRLLEPDLPPLKTRA